MAQVRYRSVPNTLPILIAAFVVAGLITALLV